MNAKHSQQTDFVILTALEEERDSLLSKLPESQKLKPSNNDVHVYYTTRLPVVFPDGSAGAYHIVITTLLGMGRVQAATAAGEAIRSWSPSYVILVGIAGGIAELDVTFGDVLVPDQIIDYELQKIAPKASKPRYQVYRVDSRLLGAAINFNDGHWHNAVVMKRPLPGGPKRHIGPIVSGDKVIASARSLVKYRKEWPKVIGVEMEAAGAAAASFQSATKPGFFMVRGVSDLADSRKDSKEAKKWRSYACEVASSYLVELLKSGPVLPSSTSLESKPEQRAYITAMEFILDQPLEHFSEEEFIAALKDIAGVDIRRIVITSIRRGSSKILIEGEESELTRILKTLQDSEIIQRRLAQKTGLEVIEYIKGEEKYRLPIEQPRKILIGDPNQERFDLLNELFSQEFALNATQARTFDELMIKARKSTWTLILIADDLPYSYAVNIISLPANLLQLEATNPHSMIGCILSEKERPDLRGFTRRNPAYIYVPTSQLTTTDRERILREFSREFSHTLPNVPRPPAVYFENDPRLREQIRSISNNFTLEDGQKHLSYIVRCFFDCDEVEVGKFLQGKSRMPLFRVRPKKANEIIGEFIIKLVDRTDLWKIKLEVRQQAEAKERLGVADYKMHFVGPRLPLLPVDFNDPELRYVAQHANWLAVCYDFLSGGMAFGRFLDLEAALIIAPEEIVQRTQGTILALKSTSRPRVVEFRIKILETALNWLCRNWYMKPDLVRREVERIWDVHDGPDYQHLAFPPYRLNRKTKGFIRNFLDGESIKMGGRLFSNWDAMYRKVQYFIGESEELFKKSQLREELSVILSPVHGNLNANNILLNLEHTSYPFLMDFSFYQQLGHALQDFAKLEAEIKYALMDRQASSSIEGLPAFDQTFSQTPLWQEMENHLLSDNWPKKKSHWHNEGYKDNVNLCLRLVQLIRRKALEVQKQSLNKQTIPPFFNEYLPALLYHTLLAIGSESLSVFKRLLAVHSAANILERLEQSS